jgi:hypothetical protein
MARFALRTLAWIAIFAVELVVTLALFAAARAKIVAWRERSAATAVTVPPLTTAPPLNFACEMSSAELAALFADPSVIRDLARLHAGVSLALIDFDPARAQVVRELNAAGIPVTAWMALSQQDGYYLNSSSAASAEARFTDLETWTAAENLHWAGVGLDIEPSTQEFSAAFAGRMGATVRPILRRLFDPSTVERARASYASLINRIHAAGYRVDTYQFFFLADERAVHSTLAERLLGIVDVHADREALMLYSSFNHAADSALAWQYGPPAQLIVVGTTTGGAQALSFDELTRDIRVAAHFSPVVGIYNLEASVHRGFLPRLIAMDWNQPVTITADANAVVLRLRSRIQSVLWTLSRLPYFALAILLIDIAIALRPKHRADSPTNRHAAAG